MHYYYEDWSLAGLKVGEEHGTDLAIVHDTPIAPSADVDGDDTIQALAYVLSERFVAGTDGDDNGQRDMNLSEISRRFDKSTNSAVSESERFSITNTLNVVTAEYPTFEEAIASTADRGSARGFIHGPGVGPI